MKLSLTPSFLLLAIPSFTDAFAARPITKKSRTTQQELQAGTFSWPWGRKFVKESLIPSFEADDTPAGKDEDEFFTDRFKDLKNRNEIEVETNSLLDRIKKGKALLVDILDRTEEEEMEDMKLKNDGVFAHIPSKDMSGVEPEILQLCATISDQIYFCESADEFKLSTKDLKTQLFIYDNHGDFCDATSPFCVAITGKTMILGWRGTHILIDLLNDAAASPQSSLAWRKHSKSIKAQGAMTSIVHNDIASHENAIIKKAKELGVTEIITTGHSLGAACAQIAHLTLRAQMEDETSPWNEIENVNVRSVGFCAVMSTVLVLDNITAETDAFVERLWKNSCNIVYENDVVPRGYGYLSFVEDFVDNAGDLLVDKKVPGPQILKNLLGFHKKVEGLVDKAVENESLSGFLGFLSQYRHLGNLIYYESEDAEPQVLEDMGAFYKNSKGKKNLFRSVKYKSVSKKDNILDEFMYWHVHPVSGPGLSFSNHTLMH